MAKDPAFLFYPGDYLRDTQVLSEPSQVAYDRIMCEHMRNICISKQRLNFLTKKLSPDHIQELLSVLTKTDDGFQITWVAESINKRKAYGESRRKNRVSKKGEDMNIIYESYVNHMENEIVNENINKIKDDSIPTFDDFWNLYAKKVDRIAVEKKWNKLSVADKNAIMEKLPAYIESTPDKQYRKDPETFISRKAWENEIISKSHDQAKQSIDMSSHPNYDAAKERDVLSCQNQGWKLTEEQKEYLKSTGRL